MSEQTNAVVVVQAAAAPATFNRLTADRVQLIKDTVCKNATDVELELFLQQCERTGLDPFNRQIYAVKRWDSRERREVMAIQIGVDGFRLIAERSGKYAGQLGPQWCGPDGVWKDVWLAEEPPTAARVGVLRKDWKEPLWGVARYAAYVQTTKDNQVTRFWARMPDLMIAKVAECQALRRAFPQEMSGLYAAEEVSDEHREDAPAPPPAPEHRPGKAAMAARAQAAAEPVAANLRERLEEAESDADVDAAAAALKAAKRDGLITPEEYEALVKLGGAARQRLLHEQDVEREAIQGEPVQAEMLPNGRNAYTG